MIKIDFQEPDTENWHNWLAQCKKEQAIHNKAVEASRKPKVKCHIYNGAKYNIKSDVYMNLNGPFHGKCAYCEQKIYGDQHGSIEHFRPKKAVADENFKAVKDHLGYYWLCYDWKNLLISCILCNGVDTQRCGGKKTGKYTRFPVRGFRATRPGEEKKEYPLLINAVWEDPQEHLKLEENGSYTWRTDRGKTCIDIFGLNGRDLPNERNNVYKNVIQKMGLLSQLLVIDPNGEQTRSLINEIREHKNGRYEFTAVAHKAIKDAKRNQKILKELTNDK